MKQKTPEGFIPAGVEKKVYEAPAIEELGSVAELTRGGGTQVIADVAVTST